MKLAANLANFERQVHVRKTEGGRQKREQVHKLQNRNLQICFFLRVLQCSNHNSLVNKTEHYLVSLIICDVLILISTVFM